MICNTSVGNDQCSLAQQLTEESHLLKLMVITLEPEWEEIRFFLVQESDNFNEKNKHLWILLQHPSSPVTPLIFLESDPQPEIEFLPHQPSAGRRSSNELSRN